MQRLTLIVAERDGGGGRRHLTVVEHLRETVINNFNKMNKY